ncbi:MAG: hypothetical protein IJZ07_00575 [Clostridia bacterium]|nr:hypothetical protein [Clostridia bacterium]
MNKTIKKAVSLALVFALIFGMTVSSSAETTKSYPDFGTYVLLGDSVASGYNDLTETETEFTRIDYSYGAIVADTIGADYIPMACPGFRTIEMRYMLEDGFEGDDYLFHDATDGEIMKTRIPEFRKNIAEAGLITLGIGGNDFGTFLMWVVTDIMEKEGICTPFVNAAKKLMSESGTENDVISSVINLADTMDSLPQLLIFLPVAVAYGIVNYVKNWDKMIEDIYALNPDVNLLVVGMFDNSIKSQEDVEKSENALIKFSLGQAIVDLANLPMKLSAEKYGYIFVDTTGTICDTYHPTYEGHKRIASRILESLPETADNSESVNIYDRTDNAGVFKTLIFFIKKAVKF